MSSHYLVGPARSVKFPVKVHIAATTIAFSSPTITKEAKQSTFGVHSVSVLALTLGIGFVMCEHAGVCVCLRREIHQK